MSSTSGKGGARRAAVPKVGHDDLVRALDSYIQEVAVKEAFNFGAYQNISRNMAASASGLAQNLLLLQAILSLGITEVGHVIMKVVLAFLVVKYPGLNKTKWTNQMWAGFVSERITTLMNHLRRVSQDQNRWRQLLAKCTPGDLAALSRLKELMVANLSGHPADPPHITGASSEMLSTERAPSECVASGPEVETPARPRAVEQEETPPLLLEWPHDFTKGSSQAQTGLPSLLLLSFWKRQPWRLLPCLVLQGMASCPSAVPRASLPHRRRVEVEASLRNLRPRRQVPVPGSSATLTPRSLVKSILPLSQGRGSHFVLA